MIVGGKILLSSLSERLRLKKKRYLDFFFFLLLIFCDFFGAKRADFGPRKYLTGGERQRVSERLKVGFSIGNGRIGFCCGFERAVMMEAVWVLDSPV